MEWKNLKLKELIYKPISGEWGKEILNKEGENPVKVLRTANFTNKGIVNYEDVVLRNIAPEKVEQKRLLYGDILVEKSGGTDKYPVGRVVFYDKKDEMYLSNNFSTVFRAKEKIVFNKFLFYYLMFNYNRGGMIKYYNQTTGIQNLRLNNLVKELEIPVPPIKIQKQIVEVLDEAQDLIDNRKDQTKLLDDLIESIFYDMFGDPVRNDRGWEVKKLDELCDMKSGGTPTRKEEKYFKGNIPWITTRALDKLYIGTEDAIEFITEEAIEKSSTKIIPQDSLMIGTRVGVGKISINKVEMCTNQDIVSLLGLEESFNMKYIYKQLKGFNEYFLTQVRGATIKGINMRVLKDLNISIPPISLQNEFAEKVQAIEQQKELMSQSLKLMEDNYNNLMQEAFKGELF